MNLDDRLERIERIRVDLVDRVAAMSDEMRTARPGPDRWSILEIVEHLVLAEEDVFGDLSNLGGLPSRPKRLRDRLLYPVVMLILRTDRMRVRAPSRSMVPRGGTTLDALRTRWEANHLRLRDYVASLDPASSGPAVFRHPVTGPMTVREALAMLDVHLRRHERQIDAIVRSLAPSD